MLIQMIENIKSTFKNFDKKNKKILQYGINFCFIITIISILILITYLFFKHEYIIYKIGILLFQLSTYYFIYFIASAITIDSLQKNLL